ncbi:hypothetical protein FF36_04202 [Frankia torreyi]|uniref:Uncharacterized protein n=1 Tax=Frankia torreyi TaxID=1856 RepID=A0A0D8BC27_9ACTN|nr:hypothetical protein FF36_04202 [Frankia torreyi]KQM03491.1 hypothetical protein FF86_103916 [Frankia sp. CpI1-P]
MGSAQMRSSRSKGIDLVAVAGAEVMQPGPRSTRFAGGEARWLPSGRGPDGGYPPGGPIERADVTPVTRRVIE